MTYFLVLGTYQLEIKPTVPLYPTSKGIKYLSENTSSVNTENPEVQIANEILKFQWENYIVKNKRFVFKLEIRVC